MALFRLKGWRVAVLVAVCLYVWAVWYPDFLRLVFKYGLWTTVSGVFDQCACRGHADWPSRSTRSSIPSDFAVVGIATLWDLKMGGARGAEGPAVTIHRQTTGGALSWRSREGRYRHGAPRDHRRDT